MVYFFLLSWLGNKVLDSSSKRSTHYRTRLREVLEIETAADVVRQVSNDHASMLLYAALHLTGVREVDENDQLLDELAVPIGEIKRFRQLGSRTPGHSESRVTSGIETTTGPLGQGVGNSLGMAIGSKWLAAHFNRPGFEVFNYNVYVVR